MKKENARRKESLIGPFGVYPAWKRKSTPKNKNKEDGKDGWIRNLRASASATKGKFLILHLFYLCFYLRLSLSCRVYAEGQEDGEN